MRNYILLLLITFTISCRNTTTTNTETNNNTSAEFPSIISEPEEEESFVAIRPLQKPELADLTGIWVYEKCDTYGGYINGYGTDIPKEELQETFENVVIEFYRTYNLYLNNNFVEWEPEAWNFGSFFFSKVGEQETPEEIRTWFKETFDVTIGEEVIVYDLPEQKYPYHRLIICPEKILMFTNGLYYASFIPSDKREYIGENYHRQYSGNYENFYVWYYENKTIKDIYPLLLSEHLFLEKEIPLTNVSIKGEELEPEVEYNWHTDDELEISASFPGGITYFEFKQDPKGTELTITYSVD